MGELFSILSNFLFVQNAIIAGLLSSIACGISGTFVVVKRISYLSGGIAHAIVGGLGIAYFLGVNPLYGALAFAFVSALLIGTVKLKMKQNEDTLISALWSVGMSIGLIFAYLTPGYNVNLLSYLFGNILLVSNESLWLMFSLDILITAIIFIFYKQFIYVCFDEEYSYLRGIKVEFIYILLLIIISLTIVVLVQSVGLILVIALLTLPSSIARMFSTTIWKMIVISIILIQVFTFSGFVFSFTADLPSGPSIILAAGVGYLISFFVNNFLRKKKLT
ncbi:MAG: metal ABC transporter permease [Melioribacteraceae bacterium]|nr:MAG: metal ABC transporter permease [Melioribacteraceae bacterium]